MPIYNRVFYVDSTFSKGTTIKWSLTGNGEFIKATKNDGKEYFVKRNIHLCYPQRDLPQAVYDLYKKSSDYVEHKQAALRELMKGLDWNEDHIVPELENFWDEDLKFTTVTPFLPGVLDDKFDYTKLSKEAFIKLCMKTAQAVAKLHSCGVIHGDLKTKNIAVRKVGSEFIPYLIDFDSSYPETEIPAWEDIGGSEGYQSPEILLYGSDEGAAPPSSITTATDVFTLGIIFHKWRTGEFPSIDLDGGSVGAAVFLDKKVTLNKALDICIGRNCGATLLSLVNWTFAKDPKDRPTAQEVFEVLSDERRVPEEFVKDAAVDPAWEEDGIEFESASVISGKGYAKVARLRQGYLKRYLITTTAGTSFDKGPEWLVTKGLAHYKVVEAKPEVDPDVDTPWTEDGTKYDLDKLREKGVLSIRRVEIGGEHRYKVVFDEIVDGKNKVWESAAATNLKLLKYII